MLKKKSIYHNPNHGSFEDELVFLGKTYKKEMNLRYGTNPHQKSAYYKLEKEDLNSLKINIIKDSKGGLSQSNLEDLYYGLRILKYYDLPACVIMKHVNPCGFAVSIEKDSPEQVFEKAFNADPRAAFGGVVLFNFKVSKSLAEEIMKTTFDLIIAPEYHSDALETLKDFSTYKKNKYLRILSFNGLDSLSRYQGDLIRYELKFFEDESFVLSEVPLTSIRTTDDLKKASCQKCHLESFFTELDEKTKRDLLYAWHLNLSIRSNSICIFKNGETLGIGTGQQDRIGALELALSKAKHNYKGKQSLKGAVMVSDGFLPFEDSIHLLAENGISAVLEPGGSLRDCEVIKTANKYQIPILFTEERAFSHH